MPCVCNYPQTSPGSFDEDMVKSIETIRQMAPKEFSCIETQWGSYPVIAIKTKIKRVHLFIAWVGLNAENGSVLMFNLEYPAVKRQRNPSKKDIQLWDKFLTKTTSVT
jgi:hypothetical protein